MKAIPKKTFLLRQEELDGGRRKNVVATKGVSIEITEKETVKFFGYFEYTDDQKKKVITSAQNNKQLKRLV